MGMNWKEGSLPVTLQDLGAECSRNGINEGDEEKIKTTENATAERLGT